MATLVTLAVLLIVGGAAGVGVYYFQDHVKPGVTLMGQAVTGQTRADITSLTADMVAHYQASLTMAGRTVQASAADLGITFDPPATVAAVMAPDDGGNLLGLYSPWQAKPVVLTMSIDQAKLQDYLNQQFVAPQQRSRAAGVMFNEGDVEYDLVPGASGIQVDAAAVAAALMAGEAVAEPLTVVTVTEPPAISDSAAQATVDQANARLATSLAAHTDAASYTVPPISIANWLTFTPDPPTGAIDLGYDTERLAHELPDMLDSNLASPPVAQQVLTGPEGQALGVQTRGQDGTVITDADIATAVTAFSQALESDSPIDVAVSTTAKAFSTETVTMGAMDPGYLQPNGTKWVEVNLTSFTVTGWEGTTKVMSSPCVTGAGGTPTHAGVFHVYLKYDSQTMTGLNADGSKYETPNVPWIAYFDRGIALHGAYWRSSFGYRGSHGCVNLPVSFAQQIYNWVDIGTLVIVHA